MNKKVLRIFSLKFLKEERIPYFLGSSRIKLPWKYLNYTNYI